MAIISELLYGICIQCPGKNEWHVRKVAEYHVLIDTIMSAVFCGSVLVPSFGFHIRMVISLVTELFFAAFFCALKEIYPVIYLVQQ